MEGSDPKEKLKSTYGTALTKNWMVWPAVQAINFKLVPLEHRVLVVNIVSLGEWPFGMQMVEFGANMGDQGGIATLATSTARGIEGWRHDSPRACFGAAAFVI